MLRYWKSISNPRMTKLIIQIPVITKSAHWQQRWQPRQGNLPYDEIEWLVIDDGSTDGTVEVAQSNGVDHIVRLPTRALPKHLWQVGSLSQSWSRYDRQHRCRQSVLCRGYPKLIKPILLGERK